MVLAGGSFQCQSRPVNTSPESASATIHVQARMVGRVTAAPSFACAVGVAVGLGGGAALAAVAGPAINTAVAASATHTRRQAGAGGHVVVMRGIGVNLKHQNCD